MIPKFGYLAKCMLSNSYRLKKIHIFTFYNNFFYVMFSFPYLRQNLFARMSVSFYYEYVVRNNENPKFDILRKLVVVNHSYLC